jgi:predicted HTH domain antitoxin
MNRMKLASLKYLQEWRFLFAAKLCELGYLSSGKAARLARMERVVFLHALARVGVPAINLRGKEIAHEIAAARKLAAAKEIVVAAPTSPDEQARSEK